MKRSYFALIIAFLALALTSCERSILEPWPPDAARDSADIWGNYYYTKGVIDRVYNDNICGHWHDFDGYGALAEACDEAENCNPTSVVQKFTNGSWNTTNTPSTYFGAIYNTHWKRQPWYNSYVGTRRVNLFLESVDKSEIYIDDPDNPTRAHDRTWSKGQAYFFRAFFGFDLMRRYGRYVITTKVEELDDPDLYRDRNTVEECVKQMLSDCDSAIEMLPALWDEDNWHRANRTAAQALKARILLYYASPLYQGNFEEHGLPAGSVGDVQRWIDAVNAYRTAINDNDFYNLEQPTVWKRPWSQEGTYNYVIGLTGNLDNHEIIYDVGYSTSYSIYNERYSLPSELEGCYGYTNPTQEMVDAFEVVTGTGANKKAVPFDWNNPDHAKDPYANRDNRFYNCILYNGVLWGTATNKQYTMYMYEAVSAEDSPDGEAHVGGKHRDRSIATFTKTGYFHRKFLSESVYSLKSGDYSTPKRSRWEFRFTELILSYAEALNEAYGPDGVDPEGGLRELNGAANIQTARQAINTIRARVQMPALANVNTPDEMREAIHHERQVELCFEAQRFFDVRRWKEGEKFGGPIHGIKITPTAYNAKGIPTSYKYEVEVVENRVWDDKYYWYPISAEEMKIYTGRMTQNPGW